MEIQTVSATMEDVVSRLRAEIATVHENLQAESEARALSERLLGEKHESLEQVRHDLSSKGESLERAEAVATNLAAELAQKERDLQVLQESHDASKEEFETQRFVQCKECVCVWCLFCMSLHDRCVCAYSHLISTPAIVQRMLSKVTLKN